MEIREAPAGEPEFLRTAREKATTAAEKAEAFLTFKPFSNLVFRMLIADARQALAEYRVAIDIFKASRHN